MCLACCPKVIETKKTLAVEFLFPIHLQVNDIEKIINPLMHKVPKGQTHFKVCLAILGPYALKG